MASFTTLALSLLSGLPASYHELVCVEKDTIVVQQIKESHEQCLDHKKFCDAYFKVEKRTVNCKCWNTETLKEDSFDNSEILLY